MLGQIIYLLRSTPWFLNSTIAMLFTSIGSGLTQIVIYGWLAENSATPISFASAFAVSTIPSLFSMQLGAWLSKMLNPFRILIFAEIMGLVTVCIIWQMIVFSNATLVIISIFLPGLCAGIAIGPFSLIIKKSFADNQFPIVSAVETIVFSTTVFVGTGVGAILYPFIHILNFLTVDIVSYLLSLLFLYRAMRFSLFQSREEIYTTSVDKFHISSLRGAKLKAFFLMPILASITAPAMALLPLAGENFTRSVFSNTFVVPAVLLIFARSIGQTLGPLILNAQKVIELFSNNLVIFLLCTGFIACYLLVFLSNSFWLACFMVILAHIFSNIIFTSSQAAFFHHFTENEIAFATVRSNQIQLIILAILGFVSGVIANFYSPLISILVISIPCLIIFFVGFRSIKSVGESYECA